MCLKILVFNILEMYRMSILKYIKFILKAPIRYSLYFISGLIPRNKNIWVFGSFGVFNDNSRYLYQYVVDNPQLGIRAIWISHKKQSVMEASKVGESYRKNSLKGLYFSLVAKVYIFSAYVSDINFFTSRNAVKVNLWHGIPLKKIEFDITTKPLVDVFQKASLFEKIKNPAVRIKYDFILSPSQYVADYSFKSAFRVTDENIIVAEYPRVSYLKTFKPLDEYQQYSKVFLYVPTWRDDGRNFLEQAQFDFEQLNVLMKEHNAIFLMKFHSATKIDVDLSLYGNLQLLPNNIDPTGLMKTADCLITDYSSIYLDYLVLDRPIIHFPFDLNEYTRNREFYFNYETILAGNKAISYDELYNEILRICKNQDNSQSKRYGIQSEFLEQTLGSEIIIKRIQNKIGV